LNSPQDLIGFAARENPRRPFLFLSKVLGKHYPAKPSEMGAVHRLLAQALPSDNTPVVFIGMAETATGLASGIFEAWKSMHPDAAAFLLLTTRYRVNGSEVLTFEETHSHAPRLFLHLPKRKQFVDWLSAARQLVLIDDELSTGNTFIHLVAALRDIMPRLEGIHVATICDFMGNEKRRNFSSGFDFPCQIDSLLKGGWTFEPREPILEKAPPAQCKQGMEVHFDDNGYGRLGRDAPLKIPKDMVDALVAENRKRRILVLGTGEFMHAAFALASAIEKQGVDARVQSTTRSPIKCWRDVHSAMRFKDNYGEGIDNYLYNFDASRYDGVWICHETQPDDTLRELASRLHARLFHFKLNDHVEEISVR
jgi:hypothetical protein